MRDSFIFYKSFYEAINDLPDNKQLEIYKAICELSLNFKEMELKGISSTIFKLIKPQLEANNKRYVNGCKGKDYGKLGGRPKKPQNNPNKTPNNNVNVNDNENDNENNNIKKEINKEKKETIFDFLENNFNRTLSPIEYEQVSKWENTELTRYAIKQAVLNGAYSIKYIQTILNSYKAKNIQTIQEAQKDEMKFKGIKENPNWINQDIKEETASKEEIEKLERRLNRE